MTRHETPTRHGRAADALIATYVRELLVDDELDAAVEPPSAATARPVEAAATSALAADATR